MLVIFAIILVSAIIACNSTKYRIVEYPNYYR